MYRNAYRRLVSHERVDRVCIPRVDGDVQFIINASILIAAMVALASVGLLVPTNVMLNDICATLTCGAAIG